MTTASSGICRSAISPVTRPSKVGAADRLQSLRLDQRQCLAGLWQPGPGRAAAKGGVEILAERFGGIWTDRGGDDGVPEAPGIGVILAIGNLPAVVLGFERGKELTVGPVRVDADAMPAGIVGIDLLDRLPRQDQGACTSTETALNRACSESEHILHGVDPWLGLAEEGGSAQGPSGEDVAAVGEVAEGDAFAVADEVGGVVTDHVAHAQAMHADFAPPAGTGLPFPPMDQICPGPTGRLGDRVGDAVGGADGASTLW